jgi:CPA2 family monovalent cation:H+ antiporter-2
MPAAHAFLKALTTVLCVAAVTTVVFQRLRQPVVLGYIIAGLIIGPHVPLPLVADASIVETLSELGVILLMFSVGLELRIRTLIQIAPTAGVTAIVQCSLMIWAGFVAGRIFGWTPLESIFTGAVIAISSTTIVSKTFEDRGIKGRLHDLVVGVLVVEDLIAVVLMATLTAIASGSHVSPGALARTIGRLAAFLLGLVAVGLYTIPRAVRAVNRLRRPETTLVAAIGLCFGVALLAQACGYSVALGAFIAGSLVAESGEVEEIERLVRPVRDIFAAVFFVSVGMMLDPALIAQHALAIVVLTLIVVAGKLVGVSFGAFLTGTDVRTSIQAGMSLAQIGEFAFIIAVLGRSLDATGDFLYPVAVSVSALTTLATPALIRAADPAAGWIVARLPRPLETFAALYGSWIEALRRSSGRDVSGAAKVRRLVRLALVDALLFVGVVVGTSLSLGAIAAFAERQLHVPARVSRLAAIAASALVSLPFCVGLLRVARRLGETLAEMALPGQPTGALDPAAAPRGTLALTLQLTSVLLFGVPILAITQPFLHGVEGVVALLALLAVLGIAFWRSASNLQGHVRAGTQMIVEALGRQLHPASPAGAHGDDAATGATDGDLAPTARELDRLLPGLGTPRPVRLDAGSSATGRTLAALDLRAATGALVLAIVRDGASVVPAAHDPLRAGDILAVAGTEEALAAAEQLLRGGAPPP